ncbi:putative transglycosylase [Pseudomonas phage pPa_SNUABM_DT01]|nr:putative transglycosylase [Pseudomonas phage pPa_SNUABM_DT01]
MAATKEQLKELQRNMKAMGLYTGVIDGLWGPASHGAFLNARRKASTMSKPSNAPDGIGVLLFAYCKAPAWSERVSLDFCFKTGEIAQKLKMGWQGQDQLMACMAFETGGTFSPTIKNGAGAPYYGIIQFGDAAAKDAGTTVAKLLKMTAEEQLTYVYNFFKPYAGKLQTLSDVYMRILYPVAVGKPEDYVLFSEANAKSKAYMQNKGLDANKDGLITKAEAAAKVEQKLVEGLHPSNLRIA